MPLSPLRFEPHFRRYLWGGRRLGTSLGKPIGTEEDFAESWEVVDHPSHCSVVACGPLQGQNLHRLVVEQGGALLGAYYGKWRQLPRPEHLRDRFPLLLKFLDCRRDLSVQIHPNDAQARELNPPDLGKTEAWYVMEAEPGSALYAGLLPGVGRHELAEAVAKGQTETVLHRIEPQPGDCFLIPAGTVHALGAGLLVAELQQASDTTFRLFDWNRVDAEGRTRPLHVSESLAVLNETLGPIRAAIPHRLDAQRERLVSCEYFAWDRCRSTDTFTVGGDGSLHILAVMEGEVSVPEDPSGRPLRRGETMLIPADCGKVTLAPGSGGVTLLDGYLPS